MRVLGIETTSNTCSTALIEKGRVINEVSIREGLVHSEKLIPLIEKMLRDTEWGIEDIEGIAVSTGPGSFTGIRIGVSTARALAQCLKIPLVGIASLDSLIYGIASKGILVCPIIDALRKEVYTSLYRGDRRIIPYKLIFIDELLEFVKKIKKKDEKIVFLGEACDLYEDKIKKSLNDVEVLLPPKRYAAAVKVALIGEKKIKRQNKSLYKNVLPFYIKRSEAEIKWNE